jgi:hypothetical protein
MGGLRRSTDKTGGLEVSRSTWRSCRLMYCMTLRIAE